jgi:predicted transcriptional regulator
MARTVGRQARLVGGQPAEFVLGLGLAAGAAVPLAIARGIDLDGPGAEPIGLGCRQCHRSACIQRSAPPAGRLLTINDRERGLTPFLFAED